MQVPKIELPQVPRPAEDSESEEEGELPEEIESFPICKIVTHCSRFDQGKPVDNVTELLSGAIEFASTTGFFSPVEPLIDQ